MRYFLVLNPGSKSGRGIKIWPKIFHAFSVRRIKFDYSITEKMSDAFNLSYNAVKNGFDTVVAVGGDGTINETINGMMSARGTASRNSQELSEKQPAFGVLYTGTSPDFCHYHGIPVDMDGALATLFSNRRKKIDLVKIIHRIERNGPAVTRFFSSCANFGLGAAVARGSNAGLRKYFGDTAGTLISILKAIYHYRPATFHITLDGRKLELHNVFNIMVGKNPLIASGIRLDVDIEKDDGKFYFVALDNLTKLSLLKELPGLYSGKITDRFRPEFPGEIIIHSGSGNDEIEYDGDPHGWLPARLTVEQKALELIC